MIPKLGVIEVRPGLRFGEHRLKLLLPDVETALFFGKAYKLDAQQLNSLMYDLFKTRLLMALSQEEGLHSHELQGYLVELGYEHLIQEGGLVIGETQPKGEILPQLWESFEIGIASSISEVAEKLKDVVGAMPGKEGQMLFRTMAMMNARRPTIGDHRAYIHHKPQQENLVILDVSGSMTEDTIKTLVDDVVALSYKADAYLAIVSNDTTWWEPGGYTTSAVLDAAAYAGTHYETLAPLLERDWGVVVTIADYDSSYSAADAIARCKGSIELVLDISLVGRPTFLGEVVGQLATEVRPLLVAADDSCCM